MSRALYRARAKAALASAPDLAGVALVSAWAGNFSASDLPVMGVATPRERGRPGTLNAFEREVLLQVVIKRLGGAEIEDQLDRDAAAIEAAVMGAFGAERLTLTPEEVTTTLNGEGEAVIGTAVVSFTLNYLKPLRG
ncbi:hypothetical protein RPE78_09610 [Thioclava litoralis]|uniref:Tail terminator n=1 Tax=Thioclava litoralis TaxID=3076557 RepID=A0ABZ1DWU2_9RHOB|nr:hypothetical protein RPE78_09610 [Thioclava sp. FTW29]